MGTSHEHGKADDAGLGPDGAGPLSVGIDTVDHLVEHLAEIITPSTIVVCIGNDLCGDDGAGTTVAKAIAGNVPWTVLDTGTVPESFLMKIVDRKPESVLLVDALHFGAAPGAVEVIEPDRIGGQGPSTHGPAPLAFLELLAMMHSCRCGVLGIQPVRTEFGSEISAPVQRGIELVVAAFRQLARSA